MTDIVLFQPHFSHLPANRLDSLHEDKRIRCCTCGCSCICDVFLNLGVHVMLLGCTHNYSIDLLKIIESPLRMQRTVEEGELTHPAPPPVCELLFTGTDQTRWKWNLTARGLGWEG